MPKVTVHLSAEAAKTLAAWDALGGLAGHSSLSARCAFLLEQAAKDRAWAVAESAARAEMIRTGILPDDDTDILL